MGCQGAVVAQENLTRWAWMSYVADTDFVIPSSGCPSPSSSVLRPLLYRTEHLWRGEKGREGAREGEEDGWPGIGSPQMWVWPQLVFGGPTPHPRL